MTTNGEVISRVANGLKAITKDSHISGRYIIGIAKTKARFLMSQKWDELTLNKEDGLIKPIPCFRFKRITSKDCGIVEFRMCDKIMKSCEKVPELLNGKVGPSILSVIGIGGNITYDYVTPRGFVNWKKRKYKKGTNGLYTIQDGYMLLLDSLNELVDLEIITTDPDQADCVSECTDSSDIESGCKSKLDSEFVCPDRFLDLVVKDTIAEVANFYRTSQSDENPNLDEHQKTKTVN